MYLKYFKLNELGWNEQILCIILKLYLLYQIHYDSNSAHIL